jgi:3-dehydroquinate dehydratase type I
MNPVNICTVVVGKSLQDFLKNLLRVQKRSNFVELRVDHIEGVSLQDIHIIRQQTYKPSIFTCRHKQEGGCFRGTEQERISLLQYANDLGFDYLDIEEHYYHSGMIKQRKSKLILSYHNFRQTPSLSFLEKKVQQMIKKKTDICKIATYIRNDNDIMRLIKLLVSVLPTKKIILLGMGEKSKIARVFFPILGSFATYACVGKGQVSAPGQPPLSSLNKIYDLLFGL